MAVTIYSRQFCGFCVRAKELLDGLGVAYREIPVDRDPRAMAEMQARSGRRTVPQIWVGSRHIGGCDELLALHRDGRLQGLLAASSGTGAGNSR